MKDADIGRIKTSVSESPENPAIVSRWWSGMGVGIEEKWIF
jgi:hypothetical protein